MQVSFRIGDVFPADDVVSPFLVGLCMAADDLMWLTRQHETGDAGESTYRLYLTCAYYREAAKFLEKGSSRQRSPRSLRIFHPSVVHVWGC